MQRRIQLTRNDYQPIAARAACLYFTVASLAQVDSMYQFSLDWFVALFQQSIMKCTAPKRAIGLRVRELVNTFSLALYQHVSRALFSQVSLHCRVCIHRGCLCLAYGAVVCSARTCASRKRGTGRFCGECCVCDSASPLIPCTLVML